jgi:hypothetical protein
MSNKGQRGNKEAKKPKKAVQWPLSPEAAVAAGVPPAADRPKKR